MMESIDHLLNNGQRKKNKGLDKSITQNSMIQKKGNSNQKNTSCYELGLKKITRIIKYKLELNSYIFLSRILDKCKSVKKSFKSGKILIDLILSNKLRFIRLHSFTKILKSSKLKEIKRRQIMKLSKNIKKIILKNVQSAYHKIVYKKYQQKLKQICNRNKQQNFEEKSHSMSRIKNQRIRKKKQLEKGNHSQLQQFIQIKFSQEFINLLKAQKPELIQTQIEVISKEIQLQQQLFSKSNGNTSLEYYLLALNKLYKNIRQVKQIKTDLNKYKLNNINKIRSLNDTSVQLQAKNYSKINQLIGIINNQTNYQRSKKVLQTHVNLKIGSENMQIIFNGLLETIKKMIKQQNQLKLINLPNLRKILETKISSQKKNINLERQKKILQNKLNQEQQNKQLYQNLIFMYSYIMQLHNNQIKNIEIEKKNNSAINDKIHYTNLQSQTKKIDSLKINLEQQAIRYKNLEQKYRILQENSSSQKNLLEKWKNDLEKIIEKINSKEIWGKQLYNYKRLITKKQSTQSKLINLNIKLLEILKQKQNQGISTLYSSQSRLNAKSLEKLQSLKIQEYDYKKSKETKIEHNYQIQKICNLLDTAIEKIQNQNNYKDLIKLKKNLENKKITGDYLNIINSCQKLIKLLIQIDIENKRKMQEEVKINTQKKKEIINIENLNASLNKILDPQNIKIDDHLVLKIKRNLQQISLKIQKIVENPQTQVQNIIKVNLEIWNRFYQIIEKLNINLKQYTHYKQTIQQYNKKIRILNSQIEAANQSKLDEVEKFNEQYQKMQTTIEKYQLKNQQHQTNQKQLKQNVNNLKKEINLLKKIEIECQNYKISIENYQQEKQGNLNQIINIKQQLRILKMENQLQLKIKEQYIEKNNEYMRDLDNHIQIIKKIKQDNGQLQKIIQNYQRDNENIKKNEQFLLNKISILEKQNQMHIMHNSQNALLLKKYKHQINELSNKLYNMDLQLQGQKVSFNMKDTEKNLKIKQLENQISKRQLNMRQLLIQNQQIQRQKNQIQQRINQIGIQVQQIMFIKDQNQKLLNQHNNIKEIINQGENTYIDIFTFCDEVKKYKIQMREFNNIKHQYEQLKSNYEHLIIVLQNQKYQHENLKSVTERQINENIINLNSLKKQNEFLHQNKKQTEENLNNLKHDHENLLQVYRQINKLLQISENNYKKVIEQNNILKNQKKSKHSIKNKQIIVPNTFVFDENGTQIEILKKVDQIYQQESHNDSLNVINIKKTNQNILLSNQNVSLKQKIVSLETELTQLKQQHNVFIKKCKKYQIELQEESNKKVTLINKLSNYEYQFQFLIKQKNQLSTLLKQNESIINKQNQIIATQVNPNKISNLKVERDYYQKQFLNLKKKYEDILSQNQFRKKNEITQRDMIQFLQKESEKFIKQIHEITSQKQKEFRVFEKEILNEHNKYQQIYTINQINMQKLQSINELLKIKQYNLIQSMSQNQNLKEQIISYQKTLENLELKSQEIKKQNAYLNGQLKQLSDQLVYSRSKQFHTSSKKSLREINLINQEDYNNISKDSKNNQNLKLKNLVKQKEQQNILLINQRNFLHQRIKILTNFKFVSDSTYQNQLRTNFNILFGNVIQIIHALQIQQQNNQIALNYLNIFDKQIRGQKVNPFQVFEEFLKKYLSEAFERKSQQILIQANQLIQLKQKMSQIVKQQLQKIDDEDQQHFTPQNMKFNKVLKDDRYMSENSKKSDIMELKYLFREFLKQKNPNFLNRIAQILNIHNYFSQNSPVKYADFI